MKLNITLTDTTPMFNWYAKVKYENHDGFHLYSSEGVQGLICGSRDKAKAIRQIVPTAKMLLKLNYDIDCDIRVISG